MEQRNMRKPREIEKIEVLTITNPNKAWVSAEIDKLIAEWTEWHDFCVRLLDEEDSPDYDRNTCSDAIKDGRENLAKHAILREKTLVFLRNHFTGGEFILTGWRRPPYENITSRLHNNTATWLQRLEILKASMEYVLVPEGYWKGQGKQFLENLSKTTAEGAIDVAASYLKNPMQD